MEYSLEGRGNSPEAAQTVLKKEQEGLLKRLGVGSLEPTRAIFTGDYNLREGVARESVGATRFSVESGKSWEDLGARTSRIAQVENYEGSFSVKAFYDLTADQSAKLQKAKKPTAGSYDSGRGSATPSFLSRL